MRLGACSAIADCFHEPLFGNSVDVGEIDIVIYKDKLKFVGEFGSVVEFWQCDGSYTEFELHIWQDKKVFMALVGIETKEFIFGSIHPNTLFKFTDLIHENPNCDLEAMKGFFIHCPIVTKEYWLSSKDDDLVCTTIGKADPALLSKILCFENGLTQSNDK